MYRKSAHGDDNRESHTILLCYIGNRFFEVSTYIIFLLFSIFVNIIAVTKFLTFADTTYTDYTYIIKVLVVTRKTLVFHSFLAVPKRPRWANNIYIYNRRDDVTERICNTFDFIDFNFFNTFYISSTRHTSYH